MSDTEDEEDFGNSLAKNDKKRSVPIAKSSKLTKKPKPTPAAKLRDEEMSDCSEREEPPPRSESDEDEEEDADEEDANVNDFDDDDDEEEHEEEDSESVSDHNSDEDAKTAAKRRVPAPLAPPNVMVDMQALKEKEYYILVKNGPAKAASARARLLRSQLLSLDNAIERLNLVPYKVQLKCNPSDRDQEWVTDGVVKPIKIPAKVLFSPSWKDKEAFFSDVANKNPKHLYNSLFFFDSNPERYYTPLARVEVAKPKDDDDDAVKERYRHFKNWQGSKSLLVVPGNCSWWQKNVAMMGSSLYDLLEPQYRKNRTSKQGVEKNGQIPHPKLTYRDIKGNETEIEKVLVSTVEQGETSASKPKASKKKPIASQPPLSFPAAPRVPPAEEEDDHSASTTEAVQGSLVCCNADWIKKELANFGIEYSPDKHQIHDIRDIQQLASGEAQAGQSRTITLETRGGCTIRFGLL